MDIAVDFKDAPEAFRTALSDPAAVTVLTSFVEAQKAAVAENNKALLGENKALKSMKTLVDTLGGEDGLKALSTAKAQLDERDEKIGKLKNGIKEGHVKALITSTLKDVGDEKLLGPHITGRIKSNIDDAGNVSVTVLGADGKPWQLADGKEAGLKDLLEEMKKDQSFAKAFNASNTTGTGSPPGNALPGAVNPWAKTSWNATDQARLYRQDPEKARSLAAAAGFTLAQ